MATRPNVTVSVIDNSFITASSEAGSAHVSGMLTLAGGLTANLMAIFGTTLEKTRQYMTIGTPGEWIAKLDGSTFGGPTGVGPTGEWIGEWYSAYNYLLYGGTLRITDVSTKFYDGTIPLDSVFTAQMNGSQRDFVQNTVAQRDDIIGIIGITYDGYTGGTVPSSGITTYPSLSVASEQLFAVGGEKVSLQITNDYSEKFINIPLASDVAGCFARTDAVSSPWFSPAGTRRGRILNIVRLLKNPSATEQDSLYNEEINSVIGVAGQGTFLFGDITRLGVDTSTLTRVNVVRLINYIKKTLGNTARSVLFEINDELTRSAFKNAATGFLQLIKDGRGLYDFKVVCDATNNPASVVDANRFVADIFIKPTKSINYVRVRITNLNSDVQL